MPVKVALPDLPEDWVPGEGSEGSGDPVDGDGSEGIDEPLPGVDGMPLLGDDVGDGRPAPPEEPVSPLGGLELPPGVRAAGILMSAILVIAACTLIFAGDDKKTDESKASDG